MKVDLTYWNILGRINVEDVTETIRVPLLMGGVVRDLTMETRGFTLELYEHRTNEWMYRLYVLRNGRRWVENNKLYLKDDPLDRVPEPFSIDSLKWVFRTYALDKLLKDHALDRRRNV